MDSETHWENVYKAKAPTALSWYRAHLDRSLELIIRAAPDRTASIIDIGGGESTLVDDLLVRGYRNVTILDVSQTALDVTRARLGEAAQNVRWLCADITEAALPATSFDVWHDRAVFHFMTSAADRAAYVQSAARSVKRGGHVIVSTFGPQGPTQCSGLATRRYDAEGLHHEFGHRFQLIESSTELHETPFGTQQQFLYCHYRLV
jgi:2-polyprenyl-3-methyl-5-hydroxy-6-metoxy-1,4-benzoquinol methylase